MSANSTAVQCLHSAGVVYGAPGPLRTVRMPAIVPAASSDTCEKPCARARVFGGWVCMVGLDGECGGPLVA